MILQKMYSIVYRNKRHMLTMCPWSISRTATSTKVFELMPFSRVMTPCSNQFQWEALHSDLSPSHSKVFQLPGRFCALITGRDFWRRSEAIHSLNFMSLPTCQQVLQQWPNRGGNLPITLPMRHNNIALVITRTAYLFSSEAINTCVSVSCAALTRVTNHNWCDQANWASPCPSMTLLCMCGTTHKKLVICYVWLHVMSQQICTWICLKSLRPHSHRDDSLWIWE